MKKIRVMITGVAGKMGQELVRAITQQKDMLLVAGCMAVTWQPVMMMVASTMAIICFLSLFISSP